MGIPCVAASATMSAMDLGPAKQRAVRGVLLLQVGRPVPTHQIVDAVWGDEPPENGENVVQKYVAGLRRALDPDRESELTVRRMFDEQTAWIAEAGADYVVAETFSFVGEALLALEAIKSAGLTAVTTLTFHQAEETRDGLSPEDACVRLAEAGADVVGLNCTRGPRTLLPLVQRVRAARPEIRLRPATGADLPLVVSLLERGFGWSGPDDLGDRLKRTAVVELHGAVVGTLFLERDDDHDASIFGFVIDPSLQGRGIGRAALRQACEQLHADGARRISLDVDVANDRALGLYTSIGFTPVTTEDYFALTWCS